MRLETQSANVTDSARFPHRVNVVVYSFALVVIASSFSVMSRPAAAQSQEKVPRALLEDMARSQYAVLCGSEAFVSCMGFSGSACQELSESAIKQCLLPLPEEISPEKLDNSAIEDCPKQVFADAGFTEEKAAMCLVEAMETEK